MRLFGKIVLVRMPRCGNVAMAVDERVIRGNIAKKLTSNSWFSSVPLAPEVKEYTKHVHVDGFVILKHNLL